MIRTNLRLMGLLFILILTFGCQKENESIDGSKTETSEEIKEDSPADDTIKEEDETPNEDVEETKSGIPVCDDEKQPIPEYIDDSITPVNNKIDIFLEENGLLIMEAESTKSDYGKWVFETTTPDFKGTGYLRYNGPFSGSSPLSYTFKIKNSGIYRLMIRNSKPEGVESDANNDCFIRMEGDFTAGTIDSCVNNSEKSSKSTSVLKQDKKFFGVGGTGEFKNPAGIMDLGHGNDKKLWATYNFKADNIYTLVITGRSSKYCIDRILLVDLHKYQYSEFSTYIKKAIQNKKKE
ncbi:hypothetical protein FHR24_001990 [Wenyingzhuangia heitensis]|uniref:Uncharacterized protein n=1 Tax=Wenyingzhuangia heitensis TaxID=1487859 RepID=A0ABX0U9N4_9FLAO|nr:hypothetical protein [Wenyingzhuangia heitensis]NIJ45522.1 hypothetical protein [Wenyingzhuangia heitensis]